MMAVLLRTHIREVHVVGGILVEVYQGSVVAVDVVLFRSASEVSHLIHVDRQTETDTDARNYQFGAFLAQGIVAWSEGSHEGSFRKFGFVGLHLGRSEGIVGFYDTRRMDAVSSDVQITGSQQVCSFQYGIFTVHVQGSFYDAEILAGLFPDL